MQTLTYTANDTLPTPLIFAVTDAATGVTTPTDITGFTIAMEIEYSTPLVKTATLSLTPTDGRCELQWASGDLKVGQWYGRLTIANAAGKKLSTEILMLDIARDFTP